MLVPLLMSFCKKICIKHYPLYTQYNELFVQDIRPSMRVKFDGLVSHIAQYNTVSVVSIGEDATRIICRVEYDVRMDRCVGFVLPLKNGLPVLDSFLATSFDATENMFATQTPARYAYNGSTFRSKYSSILSGMLWD